MIIKRVTPATIEDISALHGTDAEVVLKRHLREPLLNAFDIHKSNIAYGVTTESKEAHDACLAWYRRLLDLDEDAIISPPECIRRHVRKGGEPTC